MKNSRKHVRTATILITTLAFAVSSSGCSTMQIVDLRAGEPLHAAVEVGTQARITRRDGAVLDIRVSDIDERTVYGSGQSIALADIEQVEIRQVDVPRTSAAVAGIVAVVALLMAVVVESEAVPVP